MRQPLVDKGHSLVPAQLLFNLEEQEGSNRDPVPGWALGV